MHAIQPQEIARKCIHLSSLIYPILYAVLANRLLLLLLTGLILFLLLVMDLLRLKQNGLNRWFCRHFGFALRDAEQAGFTGSTFFMAGVFLAIFFFDQQIAILAISVLVISDTCASLVGILFGRTIICGGTKSLEGFLAFLCSALFISFLGSFYWGLVFIPFCVASICAGLLELFSKFIRCDDNLLIPLGYGAVASLILYYW